MTHASREPSSQRGVVGYPQGQWGLGAAALCLVPIFLLTLANFWYVAANPDAANVDLQGLGLIGAWAVVISVVIPWFWLAGVPLVASWIRGPGWRRSFGWVTAWKSLIWGAAGGLATLAIIFAGVVITSLFIGNDISSSAANLALDVSAYPGPFATLLLLIAFGAPFVEELAFRGLLWGAIVKRGGSPWVATIVAGVLFGAFHGEPTRLFALALGGVMLGVIRHKGGLSAAMTAHAVVNSIGAVQLWLSVR